MESTRKVITSDNKSYELSPEQYHQIGLIKSAVEDYPDPDQEIPLNEVASKEFDRIFEFLKHYEDGHKLKEIPQPLPGPDLKMVLDDWEYNFISGIEMKDVIDLINAANHLNIESLITLCSVRIAARMLEGTVEEVRDYFGIKADMTEDELKEHDKFPLD